MSSGTDNSGTKPRSSDSIATGSICFRNCGWSRPGCNCSTGFLLTLPFQSRFEQLAPYQQNIYLATLFTAVLATGFLIAPVSLHRFLFRRHARRVTVNVAHRLAQIGLALLGVSIVGVILLIFDVVLNLTAGLIAAGAVTVVLLGLWVALPLIIRDRQDPPE